MASTITLTKIDLTRTAQRREYRIEREPGIWCEFSIWSYQDDPQQSSDISSFGGSVWLYAWPSVFELVGKGTYAEHYRVRDGVVLPVKLRHCVIVYDTAAPMQR